MLIWQQEFIIRKIVTYHYWKVRQSQLSATEARDMHMRST